MPSQGHTQFFTKRDGYKPIVLKLYSVPALKIYSNKYCSLKPKLQINLRKKINILFIVICTLWTTEVMGFKANALSTNFVHSFEKLTASCIIIPDK